MHQRPANPPPETRQPTIITVRVEPEWEWYQRSIRYQDLDDAQADARLLYTAAAQLLRPKVLLRELYIDAHTEVAGVPTVTIGSVRFHGKALAALQAVHRVIGYVATCGNEMERYDLGPLDMLAPYWLDSFKNQALEAARQQLLLHCTSHFGISRPLSLNPGSGNLDLWPLEQIHGLFELLGVPGHIGVCLTPSSLMVPNKSICGLLFAADGSDYESCAFCEREPCPNRRVPFRQRL